MLLRPSRARGRLNQVNAQPVWNTTVVKTKGDLRLASRGEGFFLFWEEEPIQPFISVVWFVSPVVVFRFVKVSRLAPSVFAVVVGRHPRSRPMTTAKARTGRSLL
jgi:hypothetical protein